MIEINLYNKKIKINSPITLEKLSELYDKNNFNVLGIVNNDLKELSYEITENCSVKFLDLTTTNGQKTYKRSLSFLFIKAAHDIIPKARIELCHTLSKGQYCVIKNYDDFNQNILNKIKQRMNELVKSNIPFKKTILPVGEAIKLFKHIHREEKIHLFNHINKETVKVYNLDGYKDYFYGYLVPSTGYIKLYDAVLEKNGVVLLCPKKSNPNELTEHKPQPKLIKVFEETKEWGIIEGVGYVADLNDKIFNKKYRELIQTVEALHEYKIMKIAEQIAEKKSRVITIAGPSSSGKTSFSKRLNIQLKVLKLNSVAISLDDFFIERDKTPKDEFGNYDFESINALDLQLFNQVLVDLLEGKEVSLPTYNFTKGKREYKNNKLKIAQNEPIIIEGIHGLNNKLTAAINDKDKFKIYVSPITQLNLDYHNRISSTDSRLIRRIVRDSQFRGHDAKKTISMWESVRKGEEKNIFPFQESADATFNSTLIYELAVLKKYAVPLLKKVDKSEPEYIEANRLLKFLVYFNDIADEQDIPRISILREFIGGSRIVE